MSGITLKSRPSVAPGTISPPKAKTVSPPGTAPANDGTRFYTVKPGDTLSGILTRQYPEVKMDTVMPQVMRANSLKNKDVIRSGMRLKLPRIAAAPAKTVMPAATPQNPLQGDYKPTVQLGEADLKKIREQTPVFKRIQEKTGVPWEAIAALWYRESGGRTEVKNPDGGPFQLDPPPSQKQIRQLLKVHSSRFTTPKEIADASAKDVTDFETGAYYAACFLKEKMSGWMTPTISDPMMREAFFRYNGTGYGSPEKSPYVMNGYNEHYKDMQIKGTLPDGKGGRKSVSTTDKRPGAYVVYRQLKNLPQ